MTHAYKGLTECWPKRRVGWRPRKFAIKGRWAETFVSVHDAFTTEVHSFPALKKVVWGVRRLRANISNIYR